MLSPWWEFLWESILGDYRGHMRKSIHLVLLEQGAKSECYLAGCLWIQLGQGSSSIIWEKMLTGFFWVTTIDVFVIGLTKGGKVFFIWNLTISSYWLALLVSLLLEKMIDLENTPMRIHHSIGSKAYNATGLLSCFLLIYENVVFRKVNSTIIWDHQSI